MVDNLEGKTGIWLVEWPLSAINIVKWVLKKWFY